MKFLFDSNEEASDRVCRAMSDDSKILDKFLTIINGADNLYNLDATGEFQLERRRGAGLDFIQVDDQKDIRLGSHSCFVLFSSSHSEQLQREIRH